MVSRPSSPAFKRRRRGLLYRCEVLCCGFVTYFPLALVLALTTWAVWAEIQISMLPTTRFGTISATFGFVLYSLLNWSYLTAVFTDPGSPMNTKADLESAQLSSVTVKSTGEMRYCKKCQSRKPDRAHHCSTCRRCVLKMDHHCPWLATCVGLRNYKAFLLFLSYTSLFCWLCFGVSAAWMWWAISDNSPGIETIMPANFIILSVISGIIGLVITGFTAYHYYLTLRNRTTIESLEKTKYLSTVKMQVTQQLHEQQAHDPHEQHSFGEQLRDLGNTLTEIHANALPGVLRPEEGEERMSPAQHSLTRQLDWNEYHRRREQQQYENYLDDRDNEKLPNAFDLGWRRNLRAVLGPNKWLWPIPICNSVGDGWQWEQNYDWTRQRQVLREERRAEVQRQFGNSNSSNGNANQPNGQRQWHDAPQNHGPPPRRRSSPRQEPDETYDSYEEETDGKTKLLRSYPQNSSTDEPHPGTRVQESWNDIPDDMFGRGRSNRS